MSWIQIIESENSIKLRDQLGNFVIIPKIELMDMVFTFLDICEKQAEENKGVH